MPTASQFSSLLFFPKHGLLLQHLKERHVLEFVVANRQSEHVQAISKVRRKHVRNAS